MKIQKSRIQIVCLLLCGLIFVTGGCTNQKSFQLQVLKTRVSETNYFQIPATGEKVVVIRDSGLTEKNIKSAVIMNDPYIRIDVQLDNSGTLVLKDMTSHYQGDRIGIFVCGKLISAPIVSQTVTSGKLSIALPEGATVQDATNIVNKLK